MIARAIGKPVAKAPTIIKVNAESKFTSGRRLSTDMLLAPPRGKPKGRHRDEAVSASSSRTLCPEGTIHGARRWLTEY